MEVIRHDRGCVQIPVSEVGRFFKFRDHDLGLFGGQQNRFTFQSLFRCFVESWNISIIGCVDLVMLDALSFRAGIVRPCVPNSANKATGITGQPGAVGGRSEQPGYHLLSHLMLPLVTERRASARRVLIFHGELTLAARNVTSTCSSWNRRRRIERRIRGRVGRQQGFDPGPQRGSGHSRSRKADRSVAGSSKSLWNKDSSFLIVILHSHPRDSQRPSVRNFISFLRFTSRTGTSRFASSRRLKLSPACVGLCLKL